VPDGAELKYVFLVLEVLNPSREEGVERAGVSGRGSMSEDLKRTVGLLLHECSNVLFSFPHLGFVFFLLLAFPVEGLPFVKTSVPHVA